MPESAFECMAYLTTLPEGAVRDAIEAQFSESREAIVEKLRWARWYAKKSLEKELEVGECPACGRVTVAGKCERAHG